MPIRVSTHTDRPVVIATDFSRLLRDLVASFPTHRQFATAARLTAGQLSRWLNPRPGDQAPGVLACLRIARAARASATRVLRAAGAHEYADLLEELHEVERERNELAHGFIRTTPESHSVTPAEWLIVSQWRELTTTDHKALTIMIEHAVSARRHNRYEVRARKEGA